MRCRGANFFSSTCQASTADSSSSSIENNGTCFSTSGLQAIVHLFCRFRSQPIRSIPTNLRPIKQFSPAFIADPAVGRRALFSSMYRWLSCLPCPCPVAHPFRGEGVPLFSGEAVALWRRLYAATTPTRAIALVNGRLLRRAFLDIFPLVIPSEARDLPFPTTALPLRRIRPFNFQFSSPLRKN